MTARFRQNIRRMSIRRKIIFYGYCIFAPIIILLCLTYCIFSYKNRISDYLDSYKSHMNSMADSVGMIEKELWDISTYLCIDNDITALVSADKGSVADSNARLWFDEAPMEIVQNMLAIGGNVKTIALYPENGVRPYLRGMDGSVHLQTIDEVRATRPYKKTRELQYGTMWGSSEKKGSDTIFKSSNSDKIVLYRELYDLRRKVPLCFIALSLDRAKMERIISGYSEDGASFAFIYDPVGGELCHTGQAVPEVREYVQNSLIDNICNDDKVHTVYYADHVILLKKIYPNNNIVCAATPLALFRKQAAAGAYIVVIGLIGLLIGLYMLLLLISYVISEPVIRLTEAIKRVSTGDFSQHVEVESQDELGNMAQCFNNMVIDIRRLIEEKYVLTIREQESEFAALQAQINPHFLYNMLDSLYWQTLNAGVEDVADSILALSQVFRMLLSNGDRYVKVSHEFLLIEKYLELQKMRFGERLSFAVNLQESIAGIVIPKLLIEPFVENSVVHGIKEMEGPCSIIVSGALNNDRLIFTINDTGGGMTEEETEAVLRGQDDEAHRQRMGRYAVKNILDRLEIMYPGDYVLDIKSKKGEGTNVTMSIPAYGIPQDMKGKQRYE